MDTFSIKWWTTANRNLASFYTTPLRPESIKWQLGSRLGTMEIKLACRDVTLCRPCAKRLYIIDRSNHPAQHSNGPSGSYSNWSTNTHYIMTSLCLVCALLICNAILLLLNNQLHWDLKYSYAHSVSSRVCNYTNEFYIWQNEFYIKLKKSLHRSSRRWSHTAF